MSARVPVSTRCDSTIWQRARSVAIGQMARDPHFTLSDLVESALQRECDRLESEHGQTFPSVEGDLRRGRRPS